MNVLFWSEMYNQILTSLRRSETSWKTSSSYFDSWDPQPSTHYNMATQNLKGIIGYRPTTTRQLRLGQLRLGNYDSVNYDSVYYDSVNYDSSQLRLDQLRLQSITTPVNTTRLFEG
jgi:hypothetical protein